MAIPTVQITGKLLTPDGAAVRGGTIFVKLSQPGSALDGAVSQRVAETAKATVAADGSVTLSLVPNDAITPSGTYYAVEYRVGDGRGEARWAEKWQITGTDPLDIGAVPRIGVVPGVAVTTSAAVSASVVAAAETARTGAETARDSALAAATAASAAQAGAETARVGAEAARDAAVAALPGVEARIGRLDGADATVGGSSEVALPAPFPTIPVKFYRDSRGRYSTSFNPDAYLASWGTTRSIYADIANGSDTTGTGDSATPYKTVQKAMAVAVAAADPVIRIVVKTNGADVVLARDEFISLNSDTKAIVGKRVAIVPDDPSRRIVVTTHQRALTWTLAAGQAKTYQANRSTVTAVFDYSNCDEYGIPRRFSVKGTIAEVEATPGSWCQIGSVVYVHTLYGAPPTDDQIAVCVGVAVGKVTLAQSAELFLRNVRIVGSPNGVVLSVTNADGDYSDHRFVAWDCAFAGGNPLFSFGAASSGLSVDSVKQAWVFNSVAAYNTADGFNFHYLRIGATPPRNYYAILFNCVGYDNGLGNTIAPGINNAFTSHDGAHVAAVGCAGWNTQGPIFAMVGACNSALIGCGARLSARAAQDTLHAAFFFDQENAPAGVSGSVYLDDCQGFDTVWDLATDASGIPITLRDFVGSKIHPNAAASLTTLPTSGRVRSSVL